jgi:hypothetical protein
VEGHKKGGLKPLNNEVPESAVIFADPNLQCPRHKALREHALGDELLLYAPDQAAAFSLNTPARAIWNLCDGRHTLADICRELGSHFECAEGQLLADVRQAIHQLQELGLLEAEGVPPPAAVESDRVP